jgi:hypothetical protein
MELIVLRKIIPSVILIMDSYVILLVQNNGVTFIIKLIVV